MGGKASGEDVPVFRRDIDDGPFGCFGILNPSLSESVPGVGRRIVNDSGVDIYSIRNSQGVN